jgi:hypothetical protein
MSNFYTSGLLTLTNKFGFNVGFSYNNPVNPIDDTYSVFFDGVDERAVTTTFDNSIGSNFTCTMWVKRLASGEGDRIFSCRKNGVNNYIEFTRADSDNLRFYYGDGSGFTQVFTTGGHFADGTWSYLTFTWNGSDLKIYANGVLNVTDSNENGNILSSEINLASIYGLSSLYASCNLNELAFFNKEFNASEVWELYNNGVSADLQTLSTSANLVNWWRLGDGDTYPTLLDNVGGSDMDMINMSPANIVTDTP